MFDILVNTVLISIILVERIREFFYIFRLMFKKKKKKKIS